MTKTVYGKARRDVIKEALIITVLFLIVYYFMGLNLLNPLVLLEAVIRGTILAVFSAYYAKKKAESTLKPSYKGLLSAVLIGILLLIIFFFLAIGIAYVLQLARRNG